MKKQITTFALASLFGLGITVAAPEAQQPANASGSSMAGQKHVANPDQQTRRFAKQLNLTEDQQNQIRSILMNRKSQIQNIRSNASLSSKEMHSKMLALRQDTQSKIRSLLNDQQKSQYDNFLQAQRERAQRRSQNSAGVTRS